MLTEAPSDTVAKELQLISDVLLALPLGDTVTTLDTDTEDEPERLAIPELSAEAEAVALVLSDTDPDPLHVATIVSLALALGDPVGLLDTGADLLGVACADCVRLAVLEELWRGDEVPVLDTVLVGVPRADAVELLDFVELLVSSDVWEGDADSVVDALADALADPEEEGLGNELQESDCDPESDTLGVTDQLFVPVAVRVGVVVITRVVVAVKLFSAVNDALAVPERVAAIERDTVPLPVLVRDTDIVLDTVGDPVPLFDIVVVLEEDPVAVVDFVCRVVEDPVTVLDELLVTRVLPVIVVVDVWLDVIEADAVWERVPRADPDPDTDCETVAVILEVQDPRDDNEKEDVLVDDFVVEGLDVVVGLCATVDELL